MNNLSLEQDKCFRLSDINCALGFSQLKKLNQIIKKRKKIAKIYNKELHKYKNIINMPIIPKDQQSAWHLYIININFKKLKINKDTLIKMLYEKKIISKKLISSYGRNNSILMQHASHYVKGVNFSTGSLGHGLSVAVGLALSNKIKKKQKQILCFNERRRNERRNNLGSCYVCVSSST